MKYLWNYLCSQTWCEAITIAAGSGVIMYGVFVIISHNAKKMRGKNGK